MEYLVDAVGIVAIAFLLVLGTAQLLDDALWLAWRLARWLGITALLGKAWAAWVRVLTWPVLVAVWADTAAACAWGIYLLTGESPDGPGLGLFLVSTPLFALLSTFAWRAKVRVEATARQCPRRPPDNGAKLRAAPSPCGRGCLPSRETGA